MPLDPNEYTVRELRDAEDGTTDPDELEAAIEAEREGKNRTTAIETLESRLSDATEDEENTGPSDASSPMVRL